jgi:CheY-like chemotaxis protein
MDTVPPARPHVLVVDDDRDNADALVLVLRLEGYEPAVAYGGPAALALVAADPPAGALLDIGMPGMDGYEVARRLRRLPGMGGALLIALTGYGQEEDVSRCYEAGFDRHILKPGDPEELHRLLDGRFAAQPTS